MPQIPGLLHVRNITKEELARMDPEERKKPYACESKSVDKTVNLLAFYHECCSLIGYATHILFGE